MINRFLPTTLVSTITDKLHRLLLAKTYYCRFKTYLLFDRKKDQVERNRAIIGL
jgi:hypothetical protein